MLFSKGGFCMDPEDLGIIFNKYDKVCGVWCGVRGLSSTNMTRYADT
jgi:hypothetical protein